MASKNGKDNERERFAQYLEIDGDPSTVEEKLRTLPAEFMRQVQRKAGLAQMRNDADKNAERIRVDLYLEYRRQKDEGDKTLTEDTISAKIKSDEGYQEACAEVNRLELAEVVQQGRLEALRIMERCVNSLATALATERRLSK